MKFQFNISPTNLSFRMSLLFPQTSSPHIRNQMTNFDEFWCDFVIGDVHTISYNSSMCGNLIVHLFLILMKISVHPSLRRLSSVCDFEERVCVCVLHEFVSLFSLHRVLLIHFNEHSVSHMCFSFQISMWFCCCFCFFHLPTYTYIASHSLPHTPYPFNVEWDVRRQQYRCLLLVLNKEGTCCDAMRNTQLEFANFCFAAYLFAGSFAALFLCVMLPTQYNHYFSAVSFLIYCSLFLQKYFLYFFVSIFDAEHNWFEILMFFRWMAFIGEICLSKSITSIISVMAFYVIFIARLFTEHFYRLN